MKSIIFALLGYLTALCLLPVFVLWVAHELYVLPRESALEIVKRMQEREMR